MATVQENKKMIWDYLYSTFKNAYVAAGIMGILHKESGFNPANVQNGSFVNPNSGARYSDETIADKVYTESVDRGIELIKKKNKKPGYYILGPDSDSDGEVNYPYPCFWLKLQPNDPDRNLTMELNDIEGHGGEDGFIYDERGYGLAQWTNYRRKEKLYNLCSENWDLYQSIGSLQLQLDFIANDTSTCVAYVKVAEAKEELKDFVDVPDGQNLYTIFLNSDTVKLATALYCAGVERSGSYLAGGADRVATLQARYDSALSIYKEYVGETIPASSNGKLILPTEDDTFEDATGAVVGAGVGQVLETIIEPVPCRINGQQARAKIYHAGKWYDAQPKIYSNNSWNS